MASKATTDHETIREWAEERGGRPARVVGTERGDDVGLLRIQFRDAKETDKLQPISWDEWLKGFDQHGLAMLYDDKPGSRFAKLVDRSTVGIEEEPPPPPAPDAVELIQEQHDQVRALFRNGGDPTRRIELLDRLSLHLAVEEAIVYPTLLDGRMREKTYEAFAEHHGVMRLIADLVDAPVRDEDAIEAKLRVLQRLVEEHMQEEEREVLPAMRRMMNKEARQALGERMMAFADELTRDSGEDGALETVLSNAAVPAPM
jgi:hypothetical protein